MTVPLLLACEQREAGTVPLGWQGGRVGVLPGVFRARRSDVASAVAVGTRYPRIAGVLMSALPFDRSLAELQALLLESDTLHHFLDRLAQLTGQVLPEGNSCGVTVRQHSRAVTLAASDEQARRIDQLQYDLDEGPCLDTLATGKTHYIVDTVTETRWPCFCPAAHEQGVRSCLGLPLTGPTGLMGCYNLYSLRRDAFAPDTRGPLEVFAGNAAGALAVARKLADQAQMSDDLREALTSRAVIDQATGIIMAQQRCGAGEAFDTLRRASQHRNVKVRRLATEIISQVSGKPPEPGVFEPRRF
ncbi:MAG TPA: GAF and ANTAR domain-containing protein [Pseudonocardiaceae bacterium]|nr:GAF and ANTAR domain-containing protein [Pseudonocardiaceae bacterium]